MASPLKTDENVFPTSATERADKSWNVPIHAWVFEIEGKRLLRLLPASLRDRHEIARHLGVPGISLTLLTNFLYLVKMVLDRKSLCHRAGGMGDLPEV